jgi:hypothetical protein
MGSLSFLKFTTRSSFVYLPSPSSAPLPDAPRCSCRPCAAPPPPPRRSHQATRPPPPCPPPSRPRAGRSCSLHITPPSPEPPRLPPASPAPARVCSTSLGFKACPAAAPRPAYPAQQLLLHCNLIPRSQSLTGPPPSPLAIIDSQPHRLWTPIQCISSTAVTHQSSPSKPIFISSTRTARPQRRRAQCSAAARPRRRPAGKRPLHPDQGHQQHHTNL